MHCASSAAERAPRARKARREQRAWAMRFCSKKALLSVSVVRENASPTTQGDSKPQCGAFRSERAALKCGKKGATHPWSRSLVFFWRV